MGRFWPWEYFGHGNILALGIFLAFLFWEDFAREDFGLREDVLLVLGRFCLGRFNQKDIAQRMPQMTLRALHINRILYVPCIKPPLRNCRFHRNQPFPLLPLHPAVSAASTVFSVSTVSSASAVSTTSTVPSALAVSSTSSFPPHQLFLWQQCFPQCRE
jgi:hypothetical protein